MNILQLQSFISVARTANFRKTAQELGCSQAAITKRIAALEQELGENLFVRSTRNVKLTPFGKAYLEEVRPLVHKLEAAARRAKDFASASPAEEEPDPAPNVRKQKPQRTTKPFSKPARAKSIRPQSTPPSRESLSETAPAEDMPPELL